MPSVLQFWIELQHGDTRLSGAFSLMLAKWHLEYDSLGAVTIACLVPFVILSILFFVCASYYGRRSTMQFTLSSLILALLPMVPLSIRSLRLIYDPDDAPPFAIFQAVFASVATVIFLVFTVSPLVYITLLRKRP